MEIQFFLDAPSSYFCSWMEEFTQNVTYKIFPIASGDIALQKARKKYNNYMTMEGIYIFCKKGEDGPSWVAERPVDLITFKVIPLTTDRIEIQAECRHEAVQDYFIDLLFEIKKRWPQRNDVVQKLDTLKASIDKDFVELKQGQAAIFQSIDKVERKQLEKLTALVKHGLMEQGEMERTLDAIRRVLKLMQVIDDKITDDLKGSLRSSDLIIESEFGIQQKLELTLPIIPLILEYKLETYTDNKLVKSLVSNVREVWNNLLRKLNKEEAS